MMEFETAIGEFVADLRLLGRAEGTVKHHRSELRRLSTWCSSTGRSWAQLDRRELQRYVRGRAELAESARANMLCSLRTFYRWSVEQGYVSISPAAHFKAPAKPQAQPKALPLEDVRRLVDHLAGEDGRRARRDEALILTGLYAGLRAGELARLRWTNVDLAGGVINVRLSKMNRGRAVKLHIALRPVLYDWRQEQALGEGAPVFSLDDKPINANRVGKIAREIAAACGVQFTPHVLRHTFATWSLRRSGNVYAVSKALGHAQLKQTEVYLRNDPRDGESAVDSLPSLDNW